MLSAGLSVGQTQLRSQFDAIQMDIHNSIVFTEMMSVHQQSALYTTILSQYIMLHIFA